MTNWIQLKYHGSVQLQSLQQSWDNCRLEGKIRLGGDQAVEYPFAQQYIRRVQKHN